MFQSMFYSFGARKMLRKRIREFKLLERVLQAPCAFYDQLIIDKSIYFVENSLIFYASFKFSRGYIYEVD